MSGKHVTYSFPQTTQVLESSSFPVLLEDSHGLLLLSNQSFLRAPECSTLSTTSQIIKPLSLAAATFSEQRVLAKPPTLSLPGCIRGQGPTAGGQQHMDFTCSEAAAPLTLFWPMLLIVLNKMSIHSAELKHSGGGGGLSIK